jgi:hypothetical protein
MEYDVNDAVETAAPESSAVAQEQTNDYNEASLDPSAETLNAENARGPIPVDRFNEVINQRNRERDESSAKIKEFEQKIQSYEAKKDVYSAYERLDEMIGQNPAAQQAFQKFLQSEFAQNGQGNQPPDQMDPRMQEALQAAQTALQTSQNIVLNQYQSDLTSFLESEGIEKELLPLVQNIAQESLLKYNQNPLGGYDKVSAQKALADVKKFMDKVYHSRQTQYTKQKQQDQTPPSASKDGLPPFKKPDYSTEESRVARLMERL